MKIYKIALLSVFLLCISTILSAQPTATLSDIELASNVSQINVNLSIDGFVSNNEQYRSLTFYIYYDKSKLMINDVDFDQSILPVTITKNINLDFDFELPGSEYGGVSIVVASADFMTLEGIVASLKFSVLARSVSEIQFGRALFGGASKSFITKNAAISIPVSIEEGSVLPKKKN